MIIIFSACSITKVNDISPATQQPEYTPEQTRTITPSATPIISQTEIFHVPENGVESLSYKVIDEYPHDSGAFTEGLAIYENVLYETTGLNGYSSIRKANLANGKIQKIRYLSDEYFGEGLAIIENKMIWITWKSNTGFVIDLDSFEVLDSFSYDHEGWGLAYDGASLFMSDGTEVIHILDPGTFIEIDTIEVTENGEPVTNINELEFIEDDLYANIWLTTRIARIDPSTGNVTGWLDLGVLADQFENISHPIDVLNGIAYNQDTNQIYVTGKYWPKLFEIEISSMNN